MAQPSRKIILLSDGTGNSAGKLFRTNVWRTYQALRLSNSEQIAKYDDGVGTSDLKPLAMLGGAVGWGLKRNVLDLYTFLCRNYQPGDEIYLFGFSRGAFTVRVLAKLILSQGIINDYYSDDDLQLQARILYRRFRSGRKTKFGLASAGRAVRDFFYKSLSRIANNPKISRTPPKEIKIRFLGVWDTVDAYGLPVYELKRGIDRYIWPLALEDRVLDKRIMKACHAICLDDKRKTFHPLIWNEEDEQEFPKRSNTDEERLTQVFFAGVHANVGGGYPDDGLSYVSLNWMLKEAHKCGLKFDEIAIQQYNAATALFGKLYDSRSGFASYYRYEPRTLLDPRDVQANKIIHPKIHETVLLRMVLGTDAYAPLALPANSSVVVEADWKTVLADIRPEKNVYPMTEFTSPARDRGGQAYSNFVPDSRVASEIAHISAPHREAIELILDTVWWRRIAYFTTLGITLALAASPLVSVIWKYPLIRSALQAVGIDVDKKTIDALSAPIIDLISDTATSFAPNFMSPWVNAFRDDSANFLILLLLLVATLFWGALLDRRIDDRSAAVWNRSWNKQRIQWFEASLVWRSKAAAGIATACFVLLVWMFYLHLNRDPNIINWAHGFSEAMLQLARIFLGAILIGLTVLAIASLFLLRRISHASKQTKLAVEPRGIALWISNRIRTYEPVRKLFDFASLQIVPAAFAIAVITLAIATINRGMFTAFSTSGKICMAPDINDKTFNGPIYVLEFTEGCQPTDYLMESGQEYDVTIQMDLKEYDEEQHMTKRDDETEEDRTDRERRRAKLVEELKGLPENSPLPQPSAAMRFLGKPFRRVLTASWFQPILRVGETGNQEFKIEPYTSSTTTVKPIRDGQAFLFLNNIVVGWPRLYNLFYTQPGKLKIRIEKRERTDSLALTR